MYCIWDNWETVLSTVPESAREVNGLFGKFISWRSLITDVQDFTINGPKLMPKSHLTLRDSF